MSLACNNLVYCVEHSKLANSCQSHLTAASVIPVLCCLRQFFRHFPKRHTEITTTAMNTEPARLRKTTSHVCRELCLLLLVDGPWKNWFDSSDGLPFLVCQSFDWRALSVGVKSDSSAFVLYCWVMKSRNHYRWHHHHHSYRLGRFFINCSALWFPRMLKLTFVFQRQCYWTGKWKTGEAEQQQQSK